MGKRDDICSFLGYEKDKPTKDRRNLLKATSTFLADYEARGGKVYGKKAESIGRRLCAMNFLEEEGRGERFWPPTSDESLAYDDAEDKETIIDNVADLFFIHARSNYCKQHANQRNKKHDDTSPPSNISNRHMSNRPPTLTNTEETYLEDEEPQFTYSSSLMTIRPELCLAPWLDPPKRFDRNVAVPWVESLNPKSLPDPPENVRWPAAADKEIQYFMHRWLFYYTIDLENGTDDGVQSLVDILRNDKGVNTELDGTQLREFRKRIVDRVKFFTEVFVNHQFVEVQDDVPRMTARFRNIWTTLKYETPTPRINYRRSVEEVPRESPRKRRKLSKKAEDNAIDISRPKRKPWSEHAWRRKTIPPPADMTFPNLLSRKSPNIGPVTVVKSSQNAVEEEESEGEACDECEIHGRCETTMRNFKMSVEIPPPTKAISSEYNKIIKMEEESTIEVLPLGTTLIEPLDEDFSSETIEVVPRAHEKVTKVSSPNPDEIPIFEKTSPHAQNEAQVSKEQLPLPYQSNDRSEDRGNSQKPPALDVPVVANQLSQTVAAGPEVNEVVDTQAEVSDSAHSSPKVENQHQLSPTADKSSSPAINAQSQIIIGTSTQPLGLDVNKSLWREPVKPASPKEVVGHTDECSRGITSLLETTMEKDNHNASYSKVPSTNSFADSPQKYGPFHDLECLNKLFSSSGSRPKVTQHSHSPASIPPTSSTETHKSEIDLKSSSVNATLDSSTPRTPPSIDLISNVNTRNKIPSEGQISVASQPAMEVLKTLTRSPDTTQPQSGDSGQISVSKVLETSRKSFDRDPPGLTRTPLPSVPLTSKNCQEMANPLPAARSPVKIMEECHKPNPSPPRLPQKPVQNLQAALREPLIPTFQPINRPMNEITPSSSICHVSLGTEPPQPSPALKSQYSATSTYSAPMASQEVRSQNQSQNTDQNYKQNKALPAQNGAYEPTITGTSLGPPRARDSHLDSNPDNGVYPMAFIKNLTDSKNGIWMQANSRKRALEGTSIKPRKTRSRKKSGLPEKLATKPATVQYAPVLSAHAGQNIAPSAMQTKSPTQPVHGREHSPQPPHPQLINHLRIRDEIGVYSNSSYPPAFKTTNPSLSTSNQLSVIQTDNMAQNMLSYHANQERPMLDYLALAEKMHSSYDRYSQDRGNIETSVDVQHSTPVASSTRPPRTSSTLQIQPSLSENPQTTRSEQGMANHGTQQSEGSPNNGEQSGINSQSGLQQMRALADASEQSKINPGVVTTQNQSPSNSNAYINTSIDHRNQSSNSAHLRYSPQAGPLEAAMRYGAFVSNATGSAIPKSASVASPNTPQNLKEPQGTRSRAYNDVQQSNPTQTNQYLNQESQTPKNHYQMPHKTSPESYRSQDPWWNSLAANYNIKKILPKPVSQSDPNILHNRLLTNDTPVSTIQIVPPLQAENRESLPDTRQVTPQVSERSLSTGSQASKIYRQTPQTQQADQHSAQSSITQASPARSYSGNQYMIQPTLIQRSNSTSQSAQPPSAVQASTPNNQFLNQAPSRSSNTRVPSPKTQLHEPPNQPSNLPDTLSEGQYTKHTTGQSPNTQTADFQNQPSNQSPIQPSTAQSSVSQNRFANRPTTQFSPIQALSPQNQYAGPPVIQQASPASVPFDPEYNDRKYQAAPRNRYGGPPIAQQASSSSVPYNPEYNDRQNQVAPQYPYPKRPQQPMEAQTLTMQAQQKLFNGQQPLDWTQYRLHGPRLQTTMNSGNSSPRQPPTITTNQAANTPTMPTIFNSTLPPTPPTPAVIHTKLDTVSQYPVLTHPLIGSATPQQTPAVILRPKLDTIPRYASVTYTLATPQQTPTTPRAVGPKLDFYLQRANSIIDTTSSFSYHYMEGLSLPNLFYFFAQRSGVPLERLDELTFRCMFGEYQQFVIGKDMGDVEWKRARKRIWRNWDREVRASTQNGDDDDEDFWEVNILIGKCA
ncbi:hypothetical protein SBOR_5118 [Sclerotinia borealis F-4128]|uniref:Uncharacterized protein n=1 Tax=Sclerotinia borealis (strain F-4128) TaxID=1432307 RepID=W9CIW6_SCLBF|nr:hypothetical protein SBOR_5118 [Sclerotinia borealis F-4128]